MKAALSQMFALYDDFKSSSLFIDDCVAAIAHWTMLNLDDALINGLKAFTAKNLEAMHKIWPKIEVIAEQLDSVLGLQHHGLASWSKAARDFKD